MADRQRAMAVLCLTLALRRRHPHGRHEKPLKLIVEGRRDLLHSVSIVNQFQCLEFLRRPRLALLHRDLVFGVGNDWVPTPGIFPPDETSALAAIPQPTLDESADVILRMGWNIAPALTDKLFVFSVTEFGFGTLPDHASSPAIVVSPSQWSRQRHIEMGCAPERVVVIPHGVDPALYRPLPEDERQDLRKRLGWEGFVFLSVGTFYGNKGLELTLKAFASVSERHPEARLFLKGLDRFYDSERETAARFVASLDDAEQARVAARLGYAGGNFTFEDMAKLYQAADAYVSPYLAEGFNLPVMEAAACGLPVICTQGGATDDFTLPTFALPVASRFVRFEREHKGQLRQGWALDPELDSLRAQMERAITDEVYMAEARVAGPTHMVDSYTWRRVVDRWMTLFQGDPASP